jgi:hypothetical protein
VGAWMAMQQRRGCVDTIIHALRTSTNMRIMKRGPCGGSHASCKQPSSPWQHVTPCIMVVPLPLKFLPEIRPEDLIPRHDIQIQTFLSRCYPISLSSRRPPEAETIYTALPTTYTPQTDRATIKTSSPLLCVTLAMQHLAEQSAMRTRPTPKFKA